MSRQVFVPLPTAHSSTTGHPTHGVIACFPMDCMLRWLPAKLARRLEEQLETWFMLPRDSYDGTVVLRRSADTPDSHEISSETALDSVRQALARMSDHSTVAAKPVQVILLSATALGLGLPVQGSERCCPAFDFASLGTTLVQFFTTGLLLPAPYLVRSEPGAGAQHGASASASEGATWVVGDQSVVGVGDIRLNHVENAATVYNVDIAGVLWLGARLGIRRLVRLAEAVAIASEGLLSRRTCAPCTRNDAH